MTGRITCPGRTMATERGRRAAPMLAVLGLAAGLLAGAPAARAQDPAAGHVVATLGANNGTVPPPYHSHSSVILAGDGHVTVRVCQGYGDDSCRVFEGQAAPGAVAAVLAAAEAAGLADTPPAANPHPPVGGGSTWGSVRLGDRTVTLPAFPAAADEVRVAAVLAAIRAAIPAVLTPQAKGD